MRKKFLLTMFSLVLFAFCGTSLHAQNVAKVGDTEYATINEAIANWGKGTTLTLLADVQLSGVVKINSNESRTLDLGTFTMTAAKNQDAFQYVVKGCTSDVGLSIKADATNPGGINASGKAIIRHTKPLLNAPSKDRPYTQFFGGVFNASYIVYQGGTLGAGYTGASAPRFVFYGGEFNGTIYANRSKFIFNGGTFNGNIQISVDSNADALVKGGKFKNLSNLFGSDLNDDKFTIGSAAGVYDRGIYVDAEGYYVITSAPITEVSAKYPAVKKEDYNRDLNKDGASDIYFYYSAANTYGMFYEVASMAGTGDNVTVYEHAEVVEELDNNAAVKDFTPVLPEEVKTFEVEVIDIKATTEATTKVTFNVEPKNASGQKVSNPSAEITFRLPVPAAWSSKANVYHESDLLGAYTIKEESGAKFVEVSSSSFSEFSVEAIVPTEVEVATLVELQAALADNSNELPIIVTKTIEIPAGETVELNLNGKTVTATDNATGSYSMITNKGNLTINGEGTLQLTATNEREWNAYSSVISNTVGGKLTVNGGTIKHLGGTKMAYAIDNLTNGKGTYAATIINGGTIQSTYRAIRQFLNGVEAQNILTVNGGTIESTGGNKAIWMQDPSKAANSGTLTIGANAVINSDVYLDVTAGSTEWPVTVSIATAALKNEAKIITENVPEGYICEDKNGIFGVEFNPAYGKEAIIGETYYATLADAFAAAENGATITLLSDITVESAIADAAKGVYNIAADKNVTLDLGGKTITATDNSNGNFILFYNYGKFTINNGTVNLTATNDRDWNAQSSIILNRGGELVVESGNYVHNGGTDMAITICNSANSFGDATTTVKDGVIASTYTAIRNRMDKNTNGSGKAILNVEGGEISSNNRAIWAQVSSSSVDAPATGEINISGGEVGYVYTSCSAGAVSMTTISGGTVASFKGEAGELTVNGGAITGDITICNAAGEAIQYAVADGLYIAAVAKIGDTYYATLEAAISATTAVANTVTVLENITLTETVTVPADKTITLDLNGMTISQEKACTGNYNMILNKGNLTITDNTDEKSGKLSFKDTSAGDPTFGWGSYTVRNEGTLVVENGTIEHKGAQAFATHMICAIFQYSGKSTINGGTISTPNYRSARLWKGDMTINGGTFDGQLWVQAVDNSANLTIKGGTFEPNGNDASAVFVSNSDHDVQLAVTDGTFNGKIGCSDATKLAGAIKGGNFNEDAKANTNSALLDEGLVFAGEANDDGYYGVEDDPAYGKAAKIGDTYYETFAAAYTAAKANETVTLLADLNMSEILVLDKAITLDGNGKTLTSSAGRAINVSCADANGVTIKNLTINASGERAINIIQNTKKVSIDNVTATAANYTVNLAGSAANAVITVKNSNLTGLNVVNVGAAGAEVTVDNTTINTVDNNEIEGYSSLALNKDAVNGKIIATDVTINITGSACGDSRQATNQAENGIVTINGSTEGVSVDVAYISYGGNWYGFSTLEAAVEKANAGETIELIRDVVLDKTVTIAKSITIDGNGNTITTAETVATNNHAAFYIDGESTLDVTIKNATFDGVNGAAVRSLDANVTIDNCVFQNCTNTGIQGLVRLTQGNAIVKDSKFLSNTSPMALSFNYDAGNAEDVLVVDNCQFEGNTASTTALLYYVKGAKCTIKDSEFVDNTLECNNNGATIYLGFTENNVVTGNLFNNNTVTDGSSSTRVAGAIFFGYEAEVSGNVFKDNIASNANDDVLGQVCTSTYYDCTIDLGNNYWGGEAPVYGKDYTIQHQTGAAAFALNSYYTTYSINEQGNVVVADKVEVAYVAQVGKLGYASIKDAIAAVKEGETITILAGTHSEGTIKLPATLKNVTLKGVEGAILKDMKITSADGNSINYEGLKFDGITFDNSNIVLTGWRNNGAVYKNIAVNGCTFKNLSAANTEAAFHINCGATEAVNGFTFTNNVIDNLTGGSKSGIYAQVTGEVKVENNVINNVQFRPYVIQVTTDDGIADNFTVTGNTFSGSAVGRAQGLGNNAEGTDNVNLVVSNNIFKGITEAQQICYWNFNAEKTTADLSKNYYDIDILANPGKIYFNTSAQGVGDLVEMGIFPYYTELNADGTINTESAVQTPAAIAKIGEKNYYSLQAALNDAAAGTGNVTVEILDNINLTGIDWNPVTVSAPGYPVVTVEGNNNTITGLNDMLFAGTWAGNSGLIIKNLTIENSAIVNDKDDTAGNVGVGAFVGYPQASAIITLEDCHLKNSSVEGGHWTGGLIGMAGGYNGADGPVFMNLTIKGCSVTGSTITGKGSVGGVIGHGSCSAWTNVVIEETTVSGNTITSTGTSVNKAGAVMGTIGAAGQATTVNGVEKQGGALVAATVSDNTVTSNGTAITTIYGRQGTNTGVLELNGGSYDKYPIEEGVAYAKPAEGFVIKENANGTFGVKSFEGEGTAEKPYMINDLEELIAFRNSVNSGATTFNAPGVYVALGADIDMTGINWVGIGSMNKDHGFMGNFDGQNHTIKNLTIDNPAVDADGYAYAGLFALTEGTDKDSQNVVKNLTIENVTINTTGHIAAAAIAYAYYTVVENVTVCGDIAISGGDYTAGVLAYTRRCVNASNLSVVGNDGSFVKGNSVVGGVISDIQTNGGLVADYKNFSTENITVEGKKSVGAISGIIAGQTLDRASVKNVTLNSDDNVAGIVAGRLGAPSTVVNVAYENVTGATALIGARFSDAKAVEAKIGDTYYTTLEAALATEGEATVELLAPVTIPAGETVVFDLNKKTVVATDNATGSYAMITNKGDLTIEGEGALKLTATNNRGWNAYSSVISNTVGGKLTVNGGTIEHLGGTDMAYGIDNLTNGKGTYAETVVNGGTVKSTYRAIRQFLNGVEAQNILTVNGGTIEGDNKSIWMQDPSKNANTGTLTVAKDAELKGDVYLFVTAGSTEWPVEVSIAAAALQGESTVVTGNVPAQYVVNNNNGTWGVDELEPIAKIGEVNYYDLQAAFNAGGEITVLENITLTETVTVAAGKTVVLDLNGKTITGTDNNTEGNFYLINNNKGNLTIVDGEGSGKITLVANKERNWNSSSVVVANNLGTVTVNGGTIEHLGGTSMAYGIDNLTNGANTVAKLNITGGNIQSTYFAVRQFANNGTNNLNITGGTVGYAWMQSPNANANVANISVTGGTVKGICLSGSNANVTLNAQADCIGEDGIYGTMPAGKVLKVVEGYYTLVSAVAEVEGVSYATLAEAFAAATDDQTVTLLENVEIAELIKIEEAITLDLNGKKVTSTAQKAFEVYAKATIMNGTIEAVQRCVDTRKAVELTLEKVNLVADNYTTAYGNPQPLTIGGSENGTKVNMTNVNISAAAGYGIITFVKTELTATNSTIGGYNALYVKPGSDNSTFNFVDSDLSGSTIGNDVEGNSFSVIAVRANNVTVNVDYASTVTAAGNYSYAISFKSSYLNEAATGSSVTVAGEITGNILADLNGNTVKVKAEYADELAAAGYATIEAEDGLVAVIKAVAQIGETLYATLQEAFNAGGEVVVLTDITLTETVTVAAGKTVVLDLNGKTVSQSKECTESYSMIQNNGKLTIKGEGAITFNDLSSGGGQSWGTYIIENNRGELVVENGTLEHFGTADSDFDTNIPIQNYAGKVTIKGGTIKSTQFRSLRDFTAGGEIIINGGNFVGQVWMQGLGTGSSSLKINGGTFQPQANDASSVFITNGTNDVNVEITDGTFNGKIGCSDVDKLAGCVTGGKFNEKAKNGTNAALLATGNVFGEVDADGYYAVVTDPTKRYIANAEQLKAFAAEANAGNTFENVTVYLTADIDLDQADWTPIAKFNGTFDGQGYTISNLWVTGSGDLGFFKQVADQTEHVTGTVKNVTFENVTIVSSDAQAGLIADARLGARISNVNLVGEVTISGYRGVGGIVGAGFPVINNCKVEAEGTITATYWGAGGILGFASDKGAQAIGSTVTGTGEDLLTIRGEYGGVGGVTGTPHGAATNGAVVKNVVISSSSDYYMAYVDPNGVAGDVTVENVAVKVNDNDIVGCDAVAAIGTTPYFNIADAFDAANENGGDITLYKNVTITSTLKVNAGKTITLDLNGKTIDGTEKVSIAIMSYGDLTIKDSSAEKTGVVKAGVGTAGNAINICAGTFTLESGNIYSKNNALLIDEQAATVNINGGKITAETATKNSAVMYISSTSETVVNITAGEFVGYNGILLWNNTKVNITGGSIEAKGSAAIQGNGSKDNTEINISGGTLSGYYAAIYHPQGGELNISGGELTGWTGVVVKGGKVNISGGTINGTGAADTYRPVSSGYVDTGDALYVEHYDNSTNSENYGTPVVTVTGGTFTSVNGKAVASYVNTNNNIEALDNFISGGTFSSDVDELCAEGFVCEANNDGTYCVVEKAVAQIGETTYPSLQAAINEAQNGDVIIVLEDITLTEGVTVEAGKVVKLDLNEFTVTGTPTEAKAYAVINNKGNLTIEGEGSIVCNHNHTLLAGSTGYAVNTITNCGTLTINGATIENTSTAANQIGYAIDNNSTTGNAVVVVKSGDVSATGSNYYDGIRQFCNSLTNENSVIIEGGEVSSLWMQNPSDGGTDKNTKDVKGSFSITDGKVGVVSTEPSANFTASITGGEITSVGHFQTADGRDLVGFITGGTFGMDVTKFCHRHYKAVENNNGKWTIERVIFDQTIKLQGGWNWFSSYINIDGKEGLQAIQTSLNGNGSMIKDLETGRYSQYAVNPNDPTETVWYGKLTETSSSRVYSIRTSVEIGEFVDVVLEGSKLDPAENTNTVIIEKGWNYIAYPLDVTLSFEQALGFTPENFDVIKGKNGSAQYYWGEWIGNITHMVPGQGYMYNSNNSADIEFNFAYPASKSALVANVETVDYFWTVDAHQYPSNMTMIATLDVEGGDYEVAAFVDGEVRGSARPVYVESLDQYIVVMTINGEESANLTFKYYDLNAAEEYELSNVVVYSNNAIVGSVEKPYALTRGTVGIDETAINNINIYPNPTTTGREINLQATCDKVEVFNTLGVKVAEYQNVDSIDALETAGTYVIRVTVDGSVKHCRLIVK